MAAIVSEQHVDCRMRTTGRSCDSDGCRRDRAARFCDLYHEDSWQAIFAPFSFTLPVSGAFMDADAKKTVLRHFPYGLYVLTVAHNGEEHAMTANWVTQTAFEPPMIAVAVENTSKTIGMIRDAHLLRGQSPHVGPARPGGQTGTVLGAGAAEAQGDQDETGTRLEDRRSWPRRSAGSSAGRSLRCRRGTIRWCWVKSWTLAWRAPTRSR